MEPGRLKHERAWLMWSYRKRLARDLAHWRSQGWVTADAEAQILKDVASGRGGVGLAPVLAIIAGVLMCFAVASFVAANWQDMPRLGRLGLLLGIIWASYVAAGALASRGAGAFSDAAVLVGSAAFGASIMLVSQMYHINGNPPDGVLLWWIGALLAGVALRSNPAVALAMILVCVWWGMAMNQRNGTFWPFLPAWAVVAAAFAWQRWWPGLHIAALALSVFVVVSGVDFGRGDSHAVVALVGLAACAAALLIERQVPVLHDIAPAILGYGFAVAVAGLLGLQFLESPGHLLLIALAAFTLILCLAAIAYGLRAGHRGAVWLGYIGFSVEILALYTTTIGSILGTSLFFLSAAVIVAMLAYAAWRLADRQNQSGAPG